MCSAWVPLENNPDVLNPYMAKLGATNAKVEFVDVFGVSEELLAMVPQPAHAVLFVFPVTADSDQEARHLTDAQHDKVEKMMQDHSLFYTKQYTENACGTIAVLHALFNNMERVAPLEPDSVLASLYAKVVECHANPVDAGTVIMNCGGLAQAHSSAAAEGMTSEPDSGTPVDLHFVCFVCAGGRCIELDGRQARPILHGPCPTSSDLLSAAATVIKHKMDSNPNSFEFSITALVSSQG